MLVELLFGATTPENPRFNLNSAADVEAFLEGGASAPSSGVKLTADIALTYSPWWRGINLLANDVGKLPLNVYKRNGDDGKQKAKEHTAFPLLRRKPNANQTAFQFKRLLTSHALNHGNGYGYVFRFGDGSPREILALDPAVTYPVKQDGELLYVTTIKGERRKLPKENVLHIKGLSFDGLTGYSVWEKASESLGTGIGARKFAAVFFKNNARPNIALETPGRLNDNELKELRASWERIHSGLDNAHRVALLSGGMKLHTFSTNAREAQLLELCEFEIREIANFLGLPPHKLGDTTRTAYASLEQENLSYLGESLDPWLVCWEEECWDKLLTEQEKADDTHFIEFLREALIRASMADQAAYYRTALAGQPWMKVNEVRGKQNMDPVEGGDVIKEPLNMGRGGAENGPTPGAPPDPGKAVNHETLVEAARQGLVEAASRMIGRLAIQAAKAAKKPAEFLAWLDTMTKENHAVVAEALATPVQFAVASTGSLALAGEEADSLLEAARQALLVASECKADKLAQSVEADMARLKAQWPASWAEKLLRE